MPFSSSTTLALKEEYHSKKQIVNISLFTQTNDHPIEQILVITLHLWTKTKTI
jgi:hypothetical protein